MSGANSPQGGLTRRSFLKTTAAVAGAAALTGAGSMTALAEYNPGQVETENERLAHCVCRPNCMSFCNINVHVRDGYVTKTSKWQLPETPEYTRICQRGLTHVERIYNEERLKYPMRRVEGTDRGAGEWERIGWDEAIEEVVSKIKATQEKYGNASVAFSGFTGNQGALVGGMYSRIKSLLGASSISAGNDIAPALALARFGLGLDGGNEICDVLNSKAVVLYGHNLTDSQVHHWHFLKEAQANGTKIVVVDPSYTVAASKADLWIPIRPGSDSLLFFGLMNLIVEKGVMDTDFMIRRTVAPFLVREDTGLFLRRSDTGVGPIDTGEVDATTGEPIVYDPYMVFEEGKLVALEDAVAPELFAEYDFEGVKCATALKLQMDEIAEWTPEVVSEKTDVSFDDINDLLDIYLAGSVYSNVAYGVGNYINGAHTQAAAYMVSFMTGNYGKPGSSCGLPWLVSVGTDGAFGSPVKSNAVSFKNIDWVNVAKGGGFNGTPIKMVYFYAANPVNTAPNVNDYRDIIFPSLDYIVVADSAMTDTARYADLVLPTAQHFEYDDFAAYSTTYSVAWNDKAVDPPFEAKVDSEIVRLMADKLGFSEYFGFTDAEALQMLLETPANVEMGLTVNALKEKKFIRWAAPEPHISFPEDTPFLSASGRIEFYTENPSVLWGQVSTKTISEEERRKHHLTATWVEPSENWYEKDIMKKYPLSFLSFRGRFRVHSQYFTVGILHEIDPEPILYVNPIDAQARGVEDGGYVEAFNDRGHGVGRAVYSESVRPGTVVYPKGWQISQHKAGSWSELLNPDFTPWTCANNFPDTVCDIRPWNEEGENR